MTEAVSFFMQHVYWADGEWRMHAWSWLWCQPNRKVVTFSPGDTFWQTCLFVLCGMYIVHYTLYIVQAIFSLILKLWLRFPDLKGNSVAAVCGDSTARICFAPWMSECQRRWALFVCLHSCRQVLFVCLFICLFTLPLSYTICLFMLMENQYSDFTCLSLNYSNLDKSDACVCEYNTPAVPIPRTSDVEGAPFCDNQYWM